MREHLDIPLLTSTSTLLLATGNAHKAGEIVAILAPLLPESVRLVSLKDVGLSAPPDEIERFKTFEANARAKAVWCAGRSGLPCIADDSGICVDALNGAPGVRSARWAGPDATDADRCNLLVKELARVNALTSEKRSAKFVCACALSFPDGWCITRTGSISGEILAVAEGEGGFGYDPLFFVRPLKMSMAAVGPDVKNRISHRGRAFKSLAAQIRSDMQ